LSEEETGWEYLTKGLNEKFFTSVLRETKSFVDMELAGKTVQGVFRVLISASRKKAEIITSRDNCYGAIELLKLLMKLLPKEYTIGLYMVGGSNGEEGE